GLVGVYVGGQPQGVGVIGAAAHQEHGRRPPRKLVESADERVGIGQGGPVLDRGGPLVELGQRVGVVRRQSLEAVVGVVRQEAVIGGEHHGVVARPARQLLDLGVDL